MMGRGGWPLCVWRSAANIHRILVPNRSTFMLYLRSHIYTMYNTEGSASTPVAPHYYIGRRADCADGFYIVCAIQTIRFKPLMQFRSAWGWLSNVIYVSLEPRVLFVLWAPSSSACGKKLLAFAILGTQRLWNRLALRKTFVWFGGDFKLFFLRKFYVG